MKTYVHSSKGPFGLQEWNGMDFMQGFGFGGWIWDLYLCLVCRIWNGFEFKFTKSYKVNQITFYLSGYQKTNVFNIF